MSADQLFTLPPIDGEYYVHFPGGEAPEPGALAALRHQLHPAPLLEQVVGETDRLSSTEITKQLEDFLTAVDFHPRGDPLRPNADIPSFVRKGAEAIEHYKDKHAKTREKGKPESAEYGVGKIGEQDVVVYAMNYGFMGGSLGSVAGERYLQALELATATERPLVAVFSSGGARQDEGTLALLQMTRSVAAGEMLREKRPHVPILAVMHGETWGGVTASAMPQADLLIACQGGRMGFAGPSVIANYQGHPVSPDSQRVETHALKRNVDVLIPDMNMLVPYLDEVLTDSKLPKGHFDPSHVGPVRIVNGRERDMRYFNLTDEVVSSPIAAATAAKTHTVTARQRDEPDVQQLERTALAKDESPEEAQRIAKGDLLMARYRNTLHDVARPDTEMILRGAFDSHVPLYNRYYDLERDAYQYPSIIGALGRIGTQPFLVVGNQPSYRVKDGEIHKVPTTPTPADLKYLLRMLDLGDRLDLPAVLLTDTPGAEPSLASEMEAQYELISEVLKRHHHYGKAMLSIVTGLEGSGGGLVTAPIGDSIAMLDKSLMMVAETGAAATIMYKTPNPTHRQQADTMLALAPDSESQLKIGTIDAVIEESDDPYETVAAIREHIVGAYAELAPMKHDELHKRRYHRVRHGRAFRLNKPDGQPADAPVLEDA